MGESKRRGRLLPPHPHDILHMAVWAGEAEIHISAIEDEFDVWRCFGHATDKHRRFPHSHCDISWTCKVTERC